MDFSNKRGPSRSSLACLACRARHIKCDGGQPVCRRCQESASAHRCEYQKSRRGGLDRAALAERRRRLAAVEKDVNISQLGGPAPSVIHHDHATANRTPSATSEYEVFDAEVEDIWNDGLIDSYYRNFHKFHPLVLPRRHLASLYEREDSRPALKPLIAVMRLIGHLYRLRRWPARADELIDGYLARAPSQHPFIVQCRLLYSVVLFWYDDKLGSGRQKAAAHQLALNMSMHRREFALEHGEGSAVLAESWRRTWWWNYILGAYYLGTLGTLEFAVVDVDATVDLPCHEHEYESGSIPEPKTQEDYDNREFLGDDVLFSSFAQLIGAVKCAGASISTVPKILSGEASTQMLQTVDSMLDGWLLLLPDAPKHVMSSKGEIDELLYQAFLVVHVATVALHRPLSDLKFYQVEKVSSCSREPPREIATPELVNIHTIRVLRATEAQIRLLALPVRPFHHTPFTTCMVSEGTLALLSACNFHFKGKDLQVARDQIRMTIGCLKALGEVWPRTARNVREIQTIASHVLGLQGSDSGRGNRTDKDKDTPTSERVPSLSGGGSSGSSVSFEDNQANSISGGDFLSGLGDFDLCGLDYMGGQLMNLGEADTGLSLWPGESL